MRLRQLTRAQFGREVTASVVVSLVALPFALGVALASGVPLALGLVSAVVGGVLVGALAGCRLQVSGPAAGLIVLVFNIGDTWGLEALGVAVVASGLLQLAAGGLGIGRWFRAGSPALLYGLPHARRGGPRARARPGSRAARGAEAGPRARSR